MSAEDTRKVAELLKGERFGFLTTTTPEGKLTSRPMALQEVEFDGDLWFFAERSAPWLTHIAASPQVNVGAGSSGNWVSLTGHALVVNDVAKKKELWNSGARSSAARAPSAASNPSTTPPTPLEHLYEHYRERTGPTTRIPSSGACPQIPART